MVTTVESPRTRPGPAPDPPRTATSLTRRGGWKSGSTGHRGEVTTTAAMTPAAAEGLHEALVRLGRGRLGALAAVYDHTVPAALRLALARTRGDRAAAEEILARAYAEVRRVAGDYPASGLRGLPWVLAVVARA